MGIIEESLKLCPPEYLNRNYHKEMEVILSGIVSKFEKEKEAKNMPSLLLHSCCAPCSSYVISYLSSYFRITVFYFNPNISERIEYERRVAEQKRFIKEYPAPVPVSFIEGTYAPDKFLEISKGLEKSPEGGQRCAKCYRLRLEETAQKAKELGFDYFTTTLSISPMKSSALLNSIGDLLGKSYGVKFLFSDFKKKNGYKRSVELSNEYGLYRQDYCGCAFSKNNF